MVATGLLLSLAVVVQCRLCSLLRDEEGPGDRLLAPGLLCAGDMEEGRWQCLWSGCCRPRSSCCPPPSGATVPGRPRSPEEEPGGLGRGGGCLCLWRPSGLGVLCQGLESCHDWDGHNCVTGACLHAGVVWPWGGRDGVTLCPSPAPSPGLGWKTWSGLFFNGIFTHDAPSPVAIPRFSFPSQLL